MPADYFKISYDDESIFAGLSDSQEESSSDTTSVLLRGWSQIQDASAFLEILNRVKVGSVVSQKTIDDILGYITGVYDMTLKTSLLDGGGDDLAENWPKTTAIDLAQSKDSGFDQQEIGDGEKTDEISIQIRNIPKSSFSSPDIGNF